MSLYGCDSCKHLRRQLSAKSKELGQLHMMKLSLESTRRAWAEECQGYVMARTWTRELRAGATIENMDMTLSPAERLFAIRRA